MKIKSVLFTLFLAVSFSSFAADINESVLSSFQNEFSTAENIQWTVAGPLTKATFSVNGQVMFAYYGENGERFALGKNVALSQMPAKLMANLKNSYKEFWITEAFELTTSSDKAYYVAIESADRKVMLKSVGAEAWNRYKVTIKE